VEYNTFMLFLQVNEGNYNVGAKPQKL